MAAIKNILLQLNQLWVLHWVAILLIAWGTWLRFDHLQTHAIIFGDSARDLFAAEQALQTKTLPLLGIPSSVPRFKQGPLTIWLNMLIYPFAGRDLFLYSLVYAGIGALTLVFLYEFCLVWFDKKVGLIALSFLSASPMAVAHSRMTYHITPLPLALILYLWMVMRVTQKKPHSLFWAALSFGILFMFELSLFPLIFLLVYALWLSGDLANIFTNWQSKNIFKNSRLLNLIKQLIGGLSIGLLPEIIFDLFNGFQQLGGYAMWLIYRIAAAVLPTKHIFSVNKLSDTVQAYWNNASRIWTTQLDWTAVVGWGVVILAIIICSWQLRNHANHHQLNIILTATAVLTLGYVWHGSPSEAYFPPYLILLPLLVGLAGASIIKHYPLSWWPISVSLMVIITGQTWSIFANNFMVSSTKFPYGPSVLEHRQILRHLSQEAGGVVHLTSSDPLSSFATFFNAFEWLAPLELVTVAPTGNQVIIESNSKINFTTPTRISGQGTVRSQRFPSVTIYYSQRNAHN